MDEDEPIQDPDLAFDFDAVKAALERKRKAKPVCPWCDNDEWLVPHGTVTLLAS